MVFRGPVRQHRGFTVTEASLAVLKGEARGTSRIGDGAAGHCGLRLLRPAGAIFDRGHERVPHPRGRK